MVAATQPTQILGLPPCHKEVEMRQSILLNTVLEIQINKLQNILKKGGDISSLEDLFSS